MKSTDFAHYLQKYLTFYLPSVCGSSPQTIDSYRACFIRLLEFFESAMNIRAEKLQVKHLTEKNIRMFLLWLENERGCSSSTRNQRLAALKSFIKYLKLELPEYLNEYQKVLQIPVKRSHTKEIVYAKKDGIKLILNQPDKTTERGVRDHLILTLLYTTGIRVNELIQIRVSDVRVTEPATLLVKFGKGNKSRYIPLQKKVVALVQNYISMAGIDSNADLNSPLFQNHSGMPFTRQGINYLVNKYSKAAREIDPSIVPEGFSPHKFRHSLAMELVNDGVDLIYIRDLLGHESVTTTEIYAKADAQKKREAIEALSKEIVLEEEAKWESDTSIKEWLAEFNKNIM